MISEAAVMEKDDEEKKTAPLNHLPVMLKEVIEYLRPEPGDTFVDGTLGLGGHSEAILNIIGKSGRLIGIERDKESLALAKEKLSSHIDQCYFVRDDFRNIDKVLRDLRVEKVDGILLDLGISSFQLDHPERGFSLRVDAPLDMRIDQEQPISAEDLVKSLSQEEIEHILKTYAEERWFRRIARAIVASRADHPIKTTGDLTRIVMRAMPFRFQRQRIHPATRAFQGFRIAVNRELEALEMVLEKSISYLSEGARIGVIAFHSLEDRIVKEKFKDFESRGISRRILKKPLRPSAEETFKNHRARSAHLRVAERI